MSGLAALVTLPLVSLSLRADERFHPYHFGARWSDRPWRAVTYPLEVTPHFLDIGNFRPLGRILEHVNLLVQYQLFLATGLPMNVVLGIVRIASVVLLGLAVVWFVTRLERSGPDPAPPSSSLPLLAALALPGLVTYTGTLSSLVVFAGLYFQSAALVLLLAGAFTAPALYRSRTLTPLRLAGFAVIGGVAAATNELVHIAVLAIATVVLVQRWRFGLRLRQLLTTAAGKATLTTAAGFLAVFVPSRLWIVRACSSPDATCYAASEVSLSGWTPGLWAVRVFAGSPLRTWWSLRSSSELISLAPRLLVPLLAVVTFLLWRRARALADVEVPGRDRRVDPATLATIAAGAALVAGAALLASLSTAMQEDPSRSLSWRESPVAIAGWALVSSGLVNLVVLRVGWTRALTAVLALAAASAMALSLASNVARQRLEDADPRSLLSDRLAVETASFDRSPGGDERRCRLLVEFDELHDDANQLRRLRRGLDADARRRFGTDFCTGDGGG